MGRFDEGSGALFDGRERDMAKEGRYRLLGIFLSLDWMMGKEEMAK